MHRIDRSKTRMPFPPTPQTLLASESCNYKWRFSPLVYRKSPAKWLYSPFKTSYWMKRSSPRQYAHEVSDQTAVPYRLKISDLRTCNASSDLRTCNASSDLRTCNASLKHSVICRLIEKHKCQSPMLMFSPLSDK